jgi:hypothetical protein
MGTVDCLWQVQYDFVVVLFLHCQICNYRWHEFCQQYYRSVTIIYVIHEMVGSHQ